MNLRPTPIDGAFVVEPQRHGDERGYFARTFCAEEFAAAGLDPAVAQGNTSFNERAGTLRGMHFQRAPFGEAKLVRCTRGAIFDVIVDLREDSPSHRRWFGVRLDEDNGLSLFAPAGVAHGFQTLVDASEVAYLMSTAYVPEAADGVRWDDPAFGIAWPEPPPGGRLMSERDAVWSDYRP